MSDVDELRDALSALVDMFHTVHNCTGLVVRANGVYLFGEVDMDTARAVERARAVLAPRCPPAPSCRRATRAGSPAQS